jgi:AraC family transcriptional regulator
MDWLQRINGAMSYIEENLTEDIDYAKVAKIACCSSYHFQRMFSFITDVTIAEYVRRRRLTLAAFELQNSNIKVIDLALKYGYESPESFSRAFQNMHGVTPTLAREKGIELKAYPRMSFHISIKGDVEMNYRIEEKAAFKVFGVEEIIDTAGGNNFVRIPKMWEKCFENGTFQTLNEAAPKGQVEGLCGVNAIMCYRMTGQDNFPYMIGAIDFEGRAEVPIEFTSISVPALTWAIFKTEEHKESETTEKIQAVWKRIFPEWFPSSGYEHADGPELELYYELGKDRCYSEVWIPVVKSK